MDTVVIASLVGFISALIGTIVSHWLITRRSRREFAEKYRTTLFDKQLNAYQKLWSLLAPTSRFYTDKTIVFIRDGKPHINVTTAKKFCEAITEFFFSEHGLYLSKTSRRALFETRDAVYKNIAANKAWDITDIEITAEIRSELRNSFENLHTTIRTDLGLRALKFKPGDIGVDERLLEK